ncbi:hypothetical protein [Polaribacter cellanae]|uniref:Uncharacterized protein n=1 Tax=Polaribacter cellanae TaxID=2818493 RepID=A0A975H5N9_9FLAO|nr:hypothetical protein [Polaribacter cellanae]QTE21587.1 hypothetical protein J3359_12235 [Polaribacter cellanae]
MTSKEKHLFNLLKKKIVGVYLKNNSASAKIENWKGEDIISFQEDLFEKVNTKVSEKWFYTYFKNTPNKLPRIDMLNILCKYIGFDNWMAFKNENSKNRKQKYWFLLSIIPLLFIISFLFKTTNKFHLCFIDDDKNEPILTPLNIKILNVKDYPVYSNTNNNGCLIYETKEDIITLVITSNYYKTDTIIRHIDNNNSNVRVALDDYALMLDYYTNNKVKNWNERKAQLEKLIDKNAIIYQLYSNNIGVEIYSKKEFINLLTIPTNNLKKFKILNKDFKNGKIVKIKFIIK